jgi:hypothetical protein
MTTYNNPHNIDWNTINAEADAKGEMIAAVKTEDGITVYNPRWMQFIVAGPGGREVTARDTQLPSVMHGLDDETVGVLDGIVQLHETVLGGARYENAIWTELRGDLLCATSHLRDIPGSTWTQSDVRLADACLGLLQMFGRKRLSRAEFEFEVTSLAEALVDALKRHMDR